jgi:sigma-B regulation protein RsbU (phosphoserine phosphatase)
MAAADASSESPPPGGHGRPLEEVLALYKGLVEVSALINAITDFDELLTEIMEIARRVMRAEGSALILRNERTNQLELVVARSANGEIVTIPRDIPQNSVAGWVFTEGTSALIPDAYADPRFYPGVDAKTGLRTRAILCVPLCRRGEPIGVLQVINPLGPDRPTFDLTDQEGFEAFATLAATAIDKLRLVEEQQQNARFQQELAIATEIQQSFLPAALPLRPDIEFAATYRPALDVGGDFYDLFEVGPDELYFVVGDVAGKGVPAALLMAQSLSILRLIIVPGVPPCEALARWNQMLCRRSLRGLFVTAALGRIVPSRREVETACAGHCPPLRVSGTADPEPVKEIRQETGLPLAILPDSRYRANLLRLGPGDAMVFYTDGLIESRDAHGHGGQFGLSGARRMLEKGLANPQQIVASLLAGENSHRGDSPPQDDLTLLAFGFPA